MKKLFIAAAFVAVTVSSCVSTGISTYRIADSKAITSTMSIASVNIADLTVSDKRETFVYQVTDRDYLYGKTNATYDFLEKFGADVIVEPRYEMTQNGKSVTWKITGRPAYLKNVRLKPACPHTCNK